jgi:mRNA interferase MazF
VGSLAKGTVVLVRFPFSDLSHSKLRPAILLAECGHGDWLLCQVTSKPYGDPQAVQLDDADFQKGSLRLTSYARPTKLFTAHSSLIAGTVGMLEGASLRRVVGAIVHLLES